MICALNEPGGLFRFEEVVVVVVVVEVARRERSRTDSTLAVREEQRSPTAREWRLHPTLVSTRAAVECTLALKLNDDHDKVANSLALPSRTLVASGDRRARHAYSNSRDSLRSNSSRRREHAGDSVHHGDDDDDGSSRLEVAAL